MTRLARSLIATTAVLMLLPTVACADGLNSSHVTGSPVMQVRPDNDLAGSINLGPNAGGTVMTVSPGNGVMQVNPQGDPNTNSNAGNGVSCWSIRTAIPRPAPARATRSCR